MSWSYVLGLFCTVLGLFCTVLGLFCTVLGLFCTVLGLLTLRSIRPPPWVGLNFLLFFFMVTTACNAEIHKTTSMNQTTARGSSPSAPTCHHTMYTPTPLCHILFFVNIFFMLLSLGTHFPPHHVHADAALPYQKGVGFSLWFSLVCGVLLGFSVWFF